MIVRLFPSDQSGCGTYRMLEPGRVVSDLDLVDVQYCHDASGEGSLNVKLSGKLDNLKVAQVDHPGCDVVVLQRPAHRHLVEAIPHLQAHGVAVVVDFDDDFDSLDPRNAAYPFYDPRRNPLQNKVWAKLASSLADLVTVTTPALAKRYGAHGRVRVLPNYVPASYLDVKPAWSGNLIDSDLPRVGWAGNPKSHPGDLEVMGDAVEQLTWLDGAIFRTVGSGTTTKKLRVRDLSEVVPWAPIEDFTSLVASFDVGLVPLRDSNFNRAKSWLKGLEYAALGVPFVASPTAEYKRLAALGAGDLVRTTTRNGRAWRDALDRLLQDGIRARRAEEGRDAATKLTYEGHAEEWLQTWSDALTLRRAR